MVLSNEKLVNYDDFGGYSRVQSLEHWLILYHPCLLAAEFLYLPAAKDTQT